MAGGIVKEVVLNLNIKGGSTISGAFHALANSVKPVLNAVGQVASSFTSMRTLAGVVVGGAVVGAFQKLTHTGMEWVKSAEEQERLTRLLGFALERYGPVGEIFSRRLQSQASELQELAGIEEEATLGIQKLLAQMGVAPYQLERTTKAAVLLSKAMGIDMHTAATMLGRAAMGNTEILSRYGIVLTDAEKKGDAFEAVMKRIEGRMGGALQAEQESLTLGIKKLGLAMGENTELVGGWIASWNWLKASIRWATDELLTNAKVQAILRQAEKDRKTGKPEDKAKGEAIKAMEVEGQLAMEAAVGRVPEFMDKMVKSSDYATKGVGSLMSLMTMLGKGDWLAWWALNDEKAKSITTEAKRQEVLQYRIDQALVKETEELDKQKKLREEMNKRAAEASALEQKNLAKLLDLRTKMFAEQESREKRLGKMGPEDFTRLQAFEAIMKQAGPGKEKQAYERMPKELKEVYRETPELQEKYKFEEQLGRKRAEQMGWIEKPDVRAPVRDQRPEFMQPGNKRPEFVEPDLQQFTPAGKEEYKQQQEAVRAAYRKMDEAKRQAVRDAYHKLDEAKARESMAPIEPSAFERGYSRIAKRYAGQAEGADKFTLVVVNNVAISPKAAAEEFVKATIPPFMDAVGKLNAETANKAKRVAEQTRQNVAAAVGGG